jgi:hypothetical protein
VNPNHNSNRTSGGDATPLRGVATRALAFCALALSVVLAGCGPVRLVATANIPEPLVAKIPVTVALFMPEEFKSYVHEEERWGTDWHIDLGQAQTDAVQRLFNAMFERVVVVDSLNAATQLGEQVVAILEPAVEEYAFVTPRDAGSPFYAVSVKYRVNVYSPDGKLADSWGFTGYGNSPAGGLSNTEPLQNATASAMRDAGAKLAVEFRDQAIVRGLLPDVSGAQGGAPSDSGPPQSGTESPAPETDEATKEGEPEATEEAGEPGDSEPANEESGQPRIAKFAAVAAI